jgi:hypothetical protein
MDFLDFELEITSDEEYGYTVAVVHSPAGEARGPLELPLSDLQLENYILTLQNALLRSSTQRRRVLTPEAETVQDFGKLLFDALFSGDIRSLYAVSRCEASRRDAGLRIKLRADSQQSEITRRRIGASSMTISDQQFELIWSKCYDHFRSTIWAWFICGGFMFTIQ